MKAGDKLICTKQGAWRASELTTHRVLTRNGPEFREEVVVDGVLGEYLYLVGYDAVNKYGARECYLSKHFRPLLGQSATAELVSSFIEITETSDLPIRSPQTTEPCGS